MASQCKVLTLEKNIQDLEEEAKLLKSELHQHRQRFLAEAITEIFGEDSITPSDDCTLEEATSNIVRRLTSWGCQASASSDHKTIFFSYKSAVDYMVLHQNGSKMTWVFPTREVTEAACQKWPP